MAEFIAELNELFGGFKERAARVQQTLRGDDVAFVLVTSPSPPASRRCSTSPSASTEAQDAARRVRREPLPPAAALCAGARARVTEADAARGIAARGLALEEDAPARLVRAHDDAVKLAALDASHVRALETAPPGTPIVRVAELDTDVHDLALLAQLSDVLMSGGV